MPTANQSVILGGKWGFLSGETVKLRGKAPADGHLGLPQ